MKSYQFVEDKTINLVEINDEIDLLARMQKLNVWQNEYNDEIKEIFRRVDKLRPNENSSDQQMSVILADLHKKSGIRRIHEPFILPKNMKEIYSAQKEKFNLYYKNMTSDEKLLWLSNLDFFITLSAAS